MLPVLGGEIVERQQRVAILGQAIGRFVVFDPVGFDKGFQCRNGILLGLGHPDLLHRALGLGVQALWQLVQDVRGLVDPAALLAGCRPHLAEHASVVSMIPGVYLFRMASGLLQIAGGSPTTLEMLSATAGDGLIAAIIILAMSFGLIVPKMAIDYFGDRVARLKAP